MRKQISNERQVTASEYKHEPSHAPVETRAWEHDPDCDCYGDSVEHLPDCGNCTCEKPDCTINMKPGWRCTRKYHSDGPCALVPVPVKEMVCEYCYGRGTQAAYVGMEMRCVEVECPDCNGTGKAKIELSKQFSALRTAAEGMEKALEEIIHHRDSLTIADEISGEDLRNFLFKNYGIWESARAALVAFRKAARR